MCKTQNQIHFVMVKITKSFCHFVEPLMSFVLLISLKRTFTNSVDSDQTPHLAASDQGLHCLH